MLPLSVELFVLSFLAFLFLRGVAFLLVGVVTVQLYFLSIAGELFKNSIIVWSSLWVVLERGC